MNREMNRVRAVGKHLAVGGRPFKIRGVTYGSFAPRLDGELFPERSQIKKDFEAMARRGLNVVRTYTLPPKDLLEAAEEFDLRVLVGLDYRDWRYEVAPGRRATKRVRAEARRAVDDALDRASAHSNVLAIAVGNEVPTDVVRVHGISSVEGVLSEMVARIHEGDPEMLATYSNFPTTEYLEIDNQDLVCFNVFLENPERLRAYLRRLQVVSGDRPLLITELGLASEVHGHEEQARSIGWQLRAVDEVGCAGATVFAWTDEWNVSGDDVDGWGFGITDAGREPKPSLDVVERWASSSIKDLRAEWPTVSAVVCAYNQEKVLEECLRSLCAVDYPGFEVVVCDDGSTDATAEIAKRFPVRLLELPHAGLSNARNAGIRASESEIIAFIDADARCHPEWPYHLALSMEDPGVVASGGPNHPMPEVGLVERAVAHSPGGPVHVLKTDDRAEHVPGCNMAFTKEALARIDGFDPIYTAAGDDVDVCWKLLDADLEIGFSAAAQVEHHRRDTVRGYLRQQRGYGKAERILQSRHRHRFNRLGQARWAGFIYGGPRPLSALLRPVVYHGYQGKAPYQGVIHRPSEHALGWASALVPFAVLAALPAFPLSMLSRWWLALPGAVALLLAGYVVAVAAGVSVPPSEPRPMSLRALVGVLHVLQPLWRAWGRIFYRPPRAVDPPSQRVNGWDGDRGSWLLELNRALAARRCVVQVGEPDHPWDLEVGIGPFLSARVTTAVLWRWTPAWRYTIRPTLPAVLMVALGIALSVQVEAVAGLILLGASAAWGLMEGLLLRHNLRAAVRETTRTR